MSISVKRRTNVTVDQALLDRARAHGLNVSALTEAALKTAVGEAERRAWVAENAAAMSERRAWIGRNGLPLAAWQAWKPE